MKSRSQLTDSSLIPYNALSRRALLKKGAGAAGAAALASSPLLAACGGGSSSSGKVSLEFWDMLWGLDTYESTARGLIAQYTKQNPNVEIKYRLVPWGNFYEVFSTAVASGTTPDISTGATFQAFQWPNAVVPVNKTVEQWEEDGTAKLVIPQSIEDQRDPEGNITGLPWGYSIRCLMYNKKLFDKAGISKLPTTFPELRETAKQLTGNGVHGIGFCGDTHGGQQFLPLMITNGGGLFDEACSPAIVSDPNRETMAFIQDMVRDGSVPDQAAGWTSTDLQDAIQRGEIAMSYGDGAWWNSLSNNKDLAITPPIEGTGGEVGTVVWYLPIWLYSSCKHQPEALDFMNWWLANSQPLWTKGGCTQFPVRSDFDAEISTMQDPRAKLVREQWTPTAKPMSYPCTPAPAIMNQVEGHNFLPEMCQDILSLKPIDESLQKAQDALSKLEA